MVRGAGTPWTPQQDRAGELTDTPLTSTNTKEIYLSPFLNVGLMEGVPGLVEGVSAFQQRVEMR